MAFPVVRGVRTLASADSAPAQRGIASGLTDEQVRQRNLDAIDRYCAAWRAGDVARLQASYHDDFTLHYFGRNPLSGDHVGKAAALRTLGEVARRTNRRLVAILDVMAGPRRATVLARERFEKGDLRAEMDRVFVYVVKDGQLAECWVYDTDQSLVDRFLGGTM